MCVFSAQSTLCMLYGRLPEKRVLMMVEAGNLPGRRKRAVDNRAGISADVLTEKTRTHKLMALHLNHGKRH